VRIDSSAPTRIDLAGGTVDIWPLYLLHEGAQTLNVAITLRASCRLQPHQSGRVAIHSIDTGTRVEVDDWRSLAASHELELLAIILRHFRASGIEVTTDTQSPLGAGIAGSSALNIAVCAALARWSGRALDADALMALAMNLEARAIHVPTGVQDYRPAVYGGVSAVELGAEGTPRRAVPVDLDALEAHLVLAYTGASRKSGINNWDVFKRRIDGDRTMQALFDRITEISGRMRIALESSHWTEVAACLAEEWSLRKRLAPGVSTPAIDVMIEAAIAAGGLAAKVCGAGGGGCLAIFAPPRRTADVRAALGRTGARLLDVRIDREGLTVAADG